MSEEFENIQNELPPEPIDSEKEALIVEYKNKYLRVLADFDNYKKRAAIDQASFVQFANENLIKEMLPAIDNIERAINSSKSQEDEVVKGIALVKKQLEDTLKKFGVEEVKSIGLPYDPNIHEAIMQKESDKPEHTVLEEMQKGYTLNGRLLRPAMVIVSKKGVV